MLNRKMELPEHVRHIIRRLMSHGYEAYAVGGCVRDMMLGREPEDSVNLGGAGVGFGSSLIRKSTATSQESS